MRRGWLWLAAGGAIWALRAALNRRNPVDLRGKIVIVTGASSGIGLATAHAFAAEGAQVVLAARRAERLLDAAAHLDRYDRRALVIPTDITQEADRQALINGTLREFGRIDVLVNNAGVDWAGFLEDQDPQGLQQMIQVNLYAALRLAQLVLPGMLARNYGHIVNVSSAAGEISMPTSVGYVATKAGIRGSSEALRRELFGTGVRVSWVMPGYVRTPMIGNVDAAYLRSLGFTVHEPETTARAIVDAVRYNRRDVFAAGPLEWAARLFQRSAPGLVDWFIARFMPREVLVHMLDQAITGQGTANRQ